MGSNVEEPFACLHPAPLQEACKSSGAACILPYCRLQRCRWLCCGQPAVRKARGRLPRGWRNKRALKSLRAAYIQKLSAGKKEKRGGGEGKKKRHKHELNASFVEPTHLCNGFQPFSDCSLLNAFQRKCVSPLLAYKRPPEIPGPPGCFAVALLLSPRAFCGAAPGYPGTEAAGCSPRHCSAGELS